MTTTNTPVSQPSVEAPDIDATWQQVRDSLNHGTWSPAETSVFKGFFISGWNHRGMVDTLSCAEKARRVANRALYEGLLDNYETVMSVEARNERLATIIAAEFGGGVK